MAETIEKNAAKFYAEAKDSFDDKGIKKMLDEMAAMEQDHYEIFKDMRKHTGESERKAMVFDPDNEATMYLQAMAEQHGSEGKISVAQKLSGRENKREVLEIALNAEKDSVLFYFGMQAHISEQAGKDKLKQIIKEEIKHIHTLNSWLSDLIAQS